MGKLKRHYKNVVARTWNNANRCENDREHLSNAAMGLAGEAGEVLDCVKKTLYHKPKDYNDDVLLELGDVMYYWLKVKELYGFSLDQILEANRNKLFDRYNVDEVRS